MDAWDVIRELHAGARYALYSQQNDTLATPGGSLSHHTQIAVRWDPSARRGWRAEGQLPHTAAQMLDLYAPLCCSGTHVMGHLGQSVDGFIAGADRVSRSLNGAANLVHLHRLRALFEVVLVGHNTARADNPQLTTRLVPGPNPVRVVLDPHLRCEPELTLFNDAAAPTLLVCAADAPARVYSDATRVLRLKSSASTLRVSEALAALRAEGLNRVFVEGGGLTVSRALTEGVLRRLHVAVAPVFIGAGIPGVRLPELSRFADALRPPCETFAMAPDVLFDFAL